MFDPKRVEHKSKLSVRPFTGRTHAKHTSEIFCIFFEVFIQNLVERYVNTLRLKLGQTLCVYI